MDRASEGRRNASEHCLRIHNPLRSGLHRPFAESSFSRRLTRHHLEALWHRTVSPASVLQHTLRGYPHVTHSIPLTACSQRMPRARRQSMFQKASSLPCTGSHIMPHSRHAQHKQRRMALRRDREWTCPSPTIQFKSTSSC